VHLGLWADQLHTDFRLLVLARLEVLLDDHSLEDGFRVFGIGVLGLLVAEYGYAAGAIDFSAAEVSLVQAVPLYIE
jgi:hypothetical protein